MKLKILKMTFLVGLLLLNGVNCLASCRIMLLGDSITQGVGEVDDDADRVGYRHLLWQYLRSSGYVVDFVGSLSSGYDVPQFDARHEGHEGYTAGQVASNVYQWLVTNPADIVLLHIGTHDIGYYDTQTIVSRVESVLNNIDHYESAHNRQVTVILALIINREEDSPLTTQFNNALHDLAVARQAAGDRIALVDMEYALVYPDDMYDLLHPDSAGYAKMADVWFGSLKGYLPCGSATFSIWNPEGAVGSLIGNSSAAELGVKFRSDVDGYIKGIRFYKGPLNTGTHRGNLWTKGGTKLGTVLFANETASGWQQANFGAPIPIKANTTYIASYYAPNGRYAINRPYFTSSGVDNQPLHALRSGVDGLNGVYRVSPTSGFPTSSYLDSNYWVDVVFVRN